MDLVNSASNRTTTSYARYLISVVNGKYNSKFSGRGSKKSAISNEIVTMILDYRKNGLSDYKIAEITGIDRSKVWRIRKEYSIC